MLPRRDRTQTVLAMVGLVISLIGVGFCTLCLWAFGMVSISFMGTPNPPEQQIIGYIAQAICPIVVILALRAHVIAARYLVGSGEKPTVPTVAAGAVPSVIGALFFVAFVTRYYEIRNGLFLLLPIAVIVSWGYVALAGRGISHHLGKPRRRD